MTRDLTTISWPGLRVGEALEALARRSGLPLRPVETPAPPKQAVEGDGDALGEWIEATASWLGLEAEPVAARYTEVESLVRGAGPAILRLPGEGELRFLALLGRRGRSVLILRPDLGVDQLVPEVIRAALCRKMEAPLAAEINTLLEEAGVVQAHRPRALAAILRDRLNARQVDGCWFVRLPPGASVWRQVRQAQLPQTALALFGAHAAEYVLWTISWWMVGLWALEGRLDRGWLLAWALVLLTLVPFRLLGTWFEGVVSFRAGGIFKQRLLYGALRLEPEEVRHQGAGQLLGRVIESEAVESLALSGGLLGLLAGIELIIATAVLGLGAGGWGHALLLLGWAAVSVLIARAYLQSRRHWTETRLGMTEDLVEQMVGHRTRLAQEVPERWHNGEDQAVERYLELSRQMDWTAALLTALVPRGWLILGVLGLAPAFFSGRDSPTTLGIALGGILLAYRAFRRLATGLSHLAGAGIAWKQVAPLFHAAARPESLGSPAFALSSDGSSSGCDEKQSVIEAHDLVYRYRERGEPVLKGCSLEVSAGDRVLLEGPSGGGKSTLASLLIGLRLPQSGLLLLRGLDRQTLGFGAWRRRAVAAPQFHENHVLTETFGFNLLMGRRWPPRPGDFEEATSLCHELGLGDLLARMPAGLLQMVGETGWQLSHGERSRLYIARTLLQRTDLVVLDESFAALDPENLERALRCVLNRARTLLIIAHP